MGSDICAFVEESLARLSVKLGGDGRSTLITKEPFDCRFRLCLYTARRALLLMATSFFLLKLFL